MSKRGSEQCLLVCPSFCCRNWVWLNYRQEKALHMRLSVFLSASEHIVRLFSTCLLTYLYNASFKYPLKILAQFKKMENKA